MNTRNSDQGLREAAVQILDRLDTCVALLRVIAEEHGPTSLLAKAEVCRQLGITPHTFYAYRRQHPHHFRTVTIGHRTYMRKQVLDDFVAHLEQVQLAKRMSG